MGTQVTWVWVAKMLDFSWLMFTQVIHANDLGIDSRFGLLTWKWISNLGNLSQPVWVHFIIYLSILWRHFHVMHRPHVAIQKASDIVSNSSFHAEGWTSGGDGGFKKFENLSIFVLGSYIKHEVWEGEWRVQPTQGGERWEWLLLSISEGMDHHLDERWCSDFWFWTRERRRRSPSENGLQYSLHSNLKCRTQS